MDKQHTLQSIARQMERLSNEVYALKGAMTEFKGVLMQCDATLRQSLMSRSEGDAPTRAR
jgi:hypothetical protein